MSVKEVAIWGRPLAKMTTPELKEVAKGIEGVSGIHGMKKEELIAVLRTSKGLAAAPASQANASLRSMKETIRSLKTKRAAALEARGRKRAEVCRHQISRLKRKTRRVAV